MHFFSVILIKRPLEFFNEHDGVDRIQILLQLKGDVLET